MYVIIFRGEDGYLWIYKNTITHNRHICAVLYVEEEYKALVLECYWLSKANVKYFNNRYIYKCIYCSQQFFDLNNILYHMFMNL